jgi:NADPH:quinone reductase-like Zn-dependent oxidoreductase
MRAVTLGRDVAGVVEPVGDGVTGVSAGEEVFGFVPAIAPTVHAGAWAELIAVPEASIRRKPEGVDTAAALSIPIQHTYDLAPAPEVMQALGATHTQGKLALRVA